MSCIYAFFGGKCVDFGGNMIFGEDFGDKEVAYYLDWVAEYGKW